MGVSYKLSGAFQFSERTIVRATKKLLPELLVEPRGARLSWELRGTASRITLVEWAENLEAVSRTALAGRVEIADLDLQVALRVRPKRQPVEVKLWQPSEPLQHVGPIYSMAIVGSRLALAGLARGLHWSEVSIWDLKNNKLVARGGEGATIQAMAWSPNGEVIALGRNNGTVSLWHIADDAMRDVRVGGPRSPVFCVGWSADGTRLVATAKRAVIIDCASAKVTAKHEGKASTAAWLGERVVLAEYGNQAGPRLSVADDSLTEVAAIEPSSRLRWEVTGLPGAKAVWLFSSNASERMTPSLRRRRYPYGGSRPVACDQTGRFALRGLDEVIVLGKKVTRVPLAASVLCYAVGGQTFFVADGSGAVPMPLPPPTLPGEVVAEPVVTKSKLTPTPAAVDQEERSAEVLVGDLWRAFIRKHQPPWMTELPPDEETAFATWVEALPDEATRNRGLGNGWHWNESKSSRDGAFLGPDSITWFTDSLTYYQGSSGGDETFKSFLEGGPHCHRHRPPGVLVEILVAVWHRKYLDL